MFQVSKAQVKAGVDSTSVKIGAAISYQIEATTDPGTIVVFPEGQTFSPLEVIESLAIDTLDKTNKLKLLKEYKITQFDSGQYTIPRQKVLIGDQTLFTDSIAVEINDVVVDTTKQKMFEIKPLEEVEVSFFNWKKYLWWILVPLVLISLVVLFLFGKKKIDERKAKKIPPYEKAMLSLRELDESHLIEQESFKEYYSRLSDTARKYIDEEIYDHAMESTTDELILKLDEETKSGTLNLDTHTIEELKMVLKTADMAKFANIKPDIQTAKTDRTVIEKVINETKEAIPEPTEEELLADEEYRLEKERKAKIKRIIIGSVAAFLVITITLGSFIAIKGYDFVKDNLLGHPTKELLEGDWISSTYGFPPVTVSTPKVLLRNNFQLTEEQKQILKGNETFIYGSLIGNFYIAVTTMQYNQQRKVDFEKVPELAVKALEQQGAKNITFKSDEYETLGGAKGVKIYGEYEAVNPITKTEQRNEYSMLIFAEQGGFQQIMISYDVNDQYAKKINERVINSVELKNVE
ncbi:DUF4381 domain-containing protein [Aquimarina sp. ERC-38]|uniref:DUF4381 domain-containing protein n=1 Tax=Aquimarina sp. ERC-38 TaxID=2949996 RepID=UPI0022472633|nr:DUF4381 domain-containing protein [Aquimarina sp. ERC-38]UZO82011.1 DUF4381 domain-containing protein [Aquimarina sp. ERC-38]